MMVVLTAHPLMGVLGSTDFRFTGLATMRTSLAAKSVVWKTSDRFWMSKGYVLRDIFAAIERRCRQKPSTHDPSVRFALLSGPSGPSVVQFWFTSHMGRRCLTTSSTGSPSKALSTSFIMSMRG